MRSLLLYMIVGLASLTTCLANEPLTSAQRTRITDLWKQFGKASADTAKTRIQLEMAEIYLHYRPDSAIQLIEHAFTSAKKIGHTKGIVDALQLKGTFYEVSVKDYKKALYYYNESLAVAKAGTLYTDIHDLYGNILNLQFYLGEFINAMRIASEGLALAEKYGDKEKKAHYHNVIGFVHLHQDNYTAAEDHYRVYLDLARRSMDSVTVGDALNNIGEVLLKKKDHVSALNSFNEARKIFFDLHENGKLNKKDRLAYVLFQIGYAYGEMGDLAKAIHFTNDALQNCRKYSCNSYDVARYYIYEGHLLTRAKDYHSALQRLRAGLGIAKSINHKENTRDAYLGLHRLFANKKQYDSAYAYYGMYDALKDSIVNENTAKAISQIESIYQLEKKDAQISLLNQEKKMHEAEIRRQGLLRNVVILFSSLMVLVVALVINRMYLKRKNRLQAEINQKQTEMFNLTASVQDKERKRIAQDLHDGMGSLLSAAKLKLSSVDASPEISDTIVLLDDATAELRNISHNIMPAALSKLGLVPALKNLVEKITETRGINLELIHHGTNYRLAEEKEIFIYRIILELVNNIVKHSRATMATIQMVRHPQHINITVEDNGKGFNSDRAEAGMGLSNVRSRVQFLQGSFHIDSSLNKGTIVIIDIPC